MTWRDLPVKEMSSTTRQNAENSVQVNDAVTQMDGVTQHNAASAEESAAASTQLTGQALKMSAVVASLGDLVGNVGSETARAWEAQTPAAARPSSVATAPASAFHQIAASGAGEPDFEMSTAAKPAKVPGKRACGPWRPVVGLRASRQAHARLRNLQIQLIPARPEEEILL